MLFTPESTTSRKQSQLAPLSSRDSATVIACRKLVARRYLELGYYDSKDITDEGTPAPEAWDQLGDYYSIPGDINEGDPRATCRVIRLSQQLEPRLPLLEHINDLDEEARRRILDYMDLTDPYSVVEISALARSGGIKDDSSMEALTLYSKMFQDFLHRSQYPDHGRELWIMAVSPALMGIFNDCFGDGVISRAGPSLPYKGEDTIPCTLDPKEGMLKMLAGAISSMDNGDKDTAGLRLFIAESLIGKHEKYLSTDILDKLSHLRSMLGSDSSSAGDSHMADSLIDDKLEGKGRRKKELIASALLVGYTAIRTLVVKSDIQSADWRVFLGIELATTYPYVKGISNYWKYIKTENQNKRLAALNMAMAVGSFMLPYLYVYKRPVEAFQSSPIGSAVFGVMALYGAWELVKKTIDNRSNGEAAKFTD